MTKTIEDLLAVLYKAREYRLDDIGLGKNEIHPLAYRLKRNTDEVFQDTSFNSGYRGVRSPEIRQALSYFEYGEDCEVKESEEDDVEHSDEYYFLSRESDERTAEDRLDEFSETAKQAIDEALADLIGNRMDFIRHENDQMNQLVVADS